MSALRCAHGSSIYQLALLSTRNPLPRRLAAADLTNERHPRQFGWPERLLEDPDPAVR